MQSTGNRDKFLTVISTHKGIIYKVANAYCKSAEDRKDLLQEIILQLWKCFDKYSDKYQYSTWIYRIALNTAISFFRRETRRQQVAQPLSDSVLHLVQPAHNTVADEQIRSLQLFIGELKDLDKALMLLYLEEKSLREIAGIMDLSETNVSTKIGRIKNILRQKFLTIKT